jgi:hypothetical protein
VRPPPIARSHGIAHHGFAVPLQLLAVERGLRDPALSPVGLALRCQQTVPQQTANAVQSFGLDELVLVRHQHRFDQVRMLQEKGGAASERE